MSKSSKRSRLYKKILFFTDRFCHAIQVALPTRLPNASVLLGNAYATNLPSKTTIFL